MTNLEKLRNLLQELFQLDQADLDFGIYRIMNQKRDEIVRFLDGCSHKMMFTARWTLLIVIGVGCGMRKEAKRTWRSRGWRRRLFDGTAKK